MRRRAGYAILSFVLSVSLGCLNDIQEADLKVPAGEVPVPAGLSARTGDNEVLLSWRPVEGAGGYVVYRAVGLVVKPDLLAREQDTLFADKDVLNGRTYYYSVSAVDPTGLEGYRSEIIAATPNVYSVMINGGEAYTGILPVELKMTAPSTTDLMKIGNEPTLSGSSWESYAPIRIWRLPEGDGTKTVHVLFRDSNGSLSPVVSDSIFLDTYAMITGIEFSPTPHIYSPGSSVHFKLSVEGNETGGDAGISVEGFTGEILLYDDGNGGDPTEKDGYYETDYRFPEAVRGKDLTIAGRFTDRAGNQAPTFEAEDKLSFTDPPDPVDLLGAVDSTTSSITLKWAASEDEHFRYYRIYRDTLTGVDEQPSHLVRELSNKSQATYPDDGLVEGETYFYRLFVVNDLEETAGSNELAASTYDALPTPVVLDSLSSIGTDRLTLTWSVNQNTDFEEYRIYRATSPGVTDESFLVITITERERSYYDDFSLDMTNLDYYYRVYVYDRAGNNARSNEASTLQ